MISPIDAHHLDPHQCTLVAKAATRESMSGLTASWLKNSRHEYGNILVKTVSMKTYITATGAAKNP